MSYTTLINSNAVSTPKRRNKKRQTKILCMLGLMGLTLFMLSGCASSSSVNSAPTTTLENSGGGSGGY